MPRKIIRPTNHAIERFEQRVLPVLSETIQEDIDDKKIKNSLYKLASQAEIEVNEKTIIHVTVFFSVQDSLPIPLTLVINTRKKILLTLYISDGWQMINKGDKITWEWCA